MRRRRKLLLFGALLAILLIVIRVLRREPFFTLNMVDKRGQLSFDHYSYTDLAEVSNDERRAYCRQSSQEWEAFYREQLAEAEALSDRLEAHIRAWYAGAAEARLPEGLLPPSIDNEKTRNWTLARANEVNPQGQWYVRPAHEIPQDFSQLYFLSPDNHVTYLKLIFIAPLGAELLIEGDFPHARFMDYQILAPFDPRFPTTSGFGAPEVPIVDIDIEPDPGHTNPFRPGADRNATRRHYHITFELKAGNAAELNPEAMVAPDYRAPGNVRAGGPFAAAGPIGGGQFVASVVWLRYYAPDRDTGPLAGVPLPKATLRLKTGETFWLQPDASLAVARQNSTAPGFTTSPENPPGLLGPTVGWFKMFGFWLTFADGQAYPRVRPWGLLPKSWAEDWITSADECLFNRGPDEPAPGNHEISASGMNYNTYLFRVMMLGEDKGYALTGVLPTTPATREGAPLATTAEARYWSLCHTGNGEDGKYPALLYGCLMDDEILTNSENEYLILYTRGEERPSNARPECGVTWQDYGPESRQVFMIRWTSVMPQDYLPARAPHQNNIPWDTGEWSQPTWDRDIMGYNHQDGFMGPYQPLVHYLTRDEFEALGCPVDPAAVPRWE